MLGIGMLLGPWMLPGIRAQAWSPAARIGWSKDKDLEHFAKAAVRATRAGEQSSCIRTLPLTWEALDSGVCGAPEATRQGREAIYLDCMQCYAILMHEWIAQACTT